MKTLQEYVNDLSATENSVVSSQEGDDMGKKMKITTQIDLDETEGLFNTTADRWSRRAKHQLSKNDIANASETAEFVKGEMAVYEGQEVEVRIPLGPKNTTGIMFEGHLKMVNRSELSRLEEGVMGMMKPLDPINRIMQLAGLEHTGVVTVEETETINEDGAGTMFNQLYTANLNNPNYKNNPDAAKVATVGDVLAGLQGIIEQLPADLPADIANQLRMVPGIGANLIKTATAMTKPTTTPPAG